MLARFFVCVPIFVCVCAAQIPVSEVRVEGNSRLPAAGIVAASGLCTGSTISTSDLDAAGQKLFATGLFTGFSYRYAPRPPEDTPGRNGTAPAGYVVTLVVMEDRAQTGVAIDIPGYPEEQIWPNLRNSNPLIDKVIPDNDNAGGYYAHAIEAVLAKAGRTETIVMRTEADLTTHAVTAVFQPVNLPKVGAIRFEGNQAITSSTLSKTIGPLTIGKEFSPRGFQKIVDLNLTPLFEEKGLIAIAYPPVKIIAAAAGSVNLDVPIVEGRPWTLGKVDIAGDALPLDEMLKAAQFPTGKLANWVQVRAGIDEMEKLLRRQGYLQVVARPMRSLHDDTGIVDLTVMVVKGKQSFLGEVQFSGLDKSNERKARAAWTLKSGKPLDILYAREDYLKALRLSGATKQVNVELKPRAGTSVVDVAFTFK